MDEQIFVDGIGMISIINGTVRLDLVTYSATEKDAKGQPALEFRQRLVMAVDGFVRAAEKIQDTVNTLQRLSQQQQAQQPQRPHPVPAPAIEAAPAEPPPPPPEPVHIDPPPQPEPRRPFP